MPQGIGQTGEGTDVGSQAGQKRRVRKGGGSPVRKRPRPAAPAAAPTAAASPEPSASDMAQLMEMLGQAQSGSTADSTQQPAPRGVRGVAQNLFGGLKKLGTGNVSAGLGQMANAFNPLAARSADAAAAAAQAQQRTEKPESSDAKEFTNAQDYVSGLKDGPVKTQLEKVVKSLAKVGKKPNESQIEAIEHIARSLKENHTDLPEATRKELLKETAQEIMKDEGEKVDYKKAFDAAQDNITKRDEKGEEIINDILPCISNDEGGYNLDDDGNVKIDRGQMRKFKNSLSDTQREKYEENVAKLPEELKSVNNNTRHLHLALMTAAKSGNKVGKNTLNDLIKHAESGKGAMSPQKFMDTLESILKSKGANETLKAMKDNDKEITPENDEERKKLKERMVGDNKLFCQEKWDKMTPAEKEQAYKAQKDEDRLLAQMPEQMRQQYQQMDPRQRRNMMEQAYGNGQPLGTPQSMQNRMTPEMQQKLMDEQQKNFDAYQNQTKQQNANQIKSIDNWLESVTSTNNSMAQGLASAAQSVSGIASMLSQMRQNQGQQFMNSAQNSMDRQQKMLDKMGATSTTTS